MSQPGSSPAPDAAPAPAPTSVSSWRAARAFPDAYPGEVPSGSFCIVDDEVLPMRSRVDAERTADQEVLVDGRWTPLAELLARWGLPRWEDRVPLVAYGANRNPGTVVLKARHHRYRSPGSRAVFPLVRARAHGADVVAGGLSSQGYLYGDLQVLSPALADVDVEVWVMVLDDDAVRMLHDSEGVRSAHYAVARIEGLLVDGRHDVGALAYASAAPAFVSPVLGGPLAFSAVAARGRVLPAMTATEMVAHVLSSTGIEQEVRTLSGIAEDDLAAELMKYLNGQFWYRLHTGRRRLERCERLEALVAEAIGRSAHGVATAALLDRAGLVLGETDAYDVPASLRVGGWWT